MLSKDLSGEASEVAAGNGVEERVDKARVGRLLVPDSHDADVHLHAVAAPHRPVHQNISRNCLSIGYTILE